MDELWERGLALLCDAGGVIRQTLRDDLGLADAAPGRVFLRLVDAGSRVKALEFLSAVKTHAAAVDWELNVTLADGPTPLHFCGGQVGEQLLIIAAADGQFAGRLYEELMRLNNEQANLLRAALKDDGRLPPGPLPYDLPRAATGLEEAPPRPPQLAEQGSGMRPAALDASLFDEISRLNNELVTMQRELAKKNAELERLNQEKNRFLGMAAHDLRNPLHAILNHSGFLLEEDASASGPHAREFLEVIYASSEFMSRLVDDLLDVARIESGHLQLDLTAVDLVALVTRNVALNRTLAAKHHIEIVLRAIPVPLAIVDAAKIEQVLNNLIGNAIKFSPPGRRVEVHLTPAGDDFQLSVRDQGPGIAPDEQAALFRPFRRGRPGTAGEKSTGLGLMIVKRIVEGHGGRIWLVSQVGQGTTFFVAIPLEPRP